MNLRISSKMLAGYLAMAALLLIGGVLTVFYTYRMQDVAARLISENASSLKVAQELEVALFRMRGLTSNYILDEDPIWLVTLEERKKEWQSWMTKARQTARTQVENEILENVSRLFLDYERNLKTAAELRNIDKTSEAKRLLQLTSREEFDKIYEQCEAFVAVNEQDMYAAEEKIRRTNATMRAAMYGLGLGGVILGCLLGLVISRSIVKPIYELVLKVRGAAGDEVVERVDAASGSELEELDRHVRALIDHVNATTADLEKNRQLLARSERLAALGKVAAGVAHEIRNPLTAIKMLIYAAQEDAASDEEKRKDMAVILKEIDRLERFVQNFLHFARPPDPQFALANLNEIVRETLALLAPRLQQTGAQLVTSYLAEADTILADADQIKQVVMNLLLNAAQAMPRGGRLTVATMPALEENGKKWLEIQISDTGHGIPEALLDTIFDPLVSGRKDGVGLGLSVAYQIVYRHGGWIEAANNKTGGAVFTVRLPCTR